MDLRDYVHVLRRRWRLLTACVLLFGLLGLGLALSSTPIYTARTQLFVAAQDQSSGSIGNAYQGGLFVQQRVKSYADIIKTPRVSSLVVEELRLNLDAAAVSRMVQAEAPIDTVLLNVTVDNSDPRLAQQVADSLGRQFARLVDSLERPQDGRPSPVKVSVVQPPQLPTVPTSPRPRLNLAVGLLFGFVVGGAAALAREALDTSVKTPEQAADIVGAPRLGAITLDPDAASRPLIVQVEPNSPRAEAFRQLRTNLQFVDVSHTLRSVVVTSSVPGEGKSTTTCNLAISLAQAGVRVVLVEGDVRRPKVAEYMGIEGSVGLTSVLLGRVELDDALQEWGDLPLAILPSGPLPPNPSELLGSAGMEELIRALEARADVVLIDAPPLLPVTDASVLGVLTSGVVMLVRSGKTTRDELRRASDLINAVGATTLGVVVNMLPTTGPDSYGYGYGYGYGYAPAPTEGGTPGGRSRRLFPARSTLTRTPGPPTPASPPPPHPTVSPPVAVALDATDAGEAVPASPEAAKPMEPAPLPLPAGDAARHAYEMSTLDRPGRPEGPPHAPASASPRDSGTLPATGVAPAAEAEDAGPGAGSANAPRN